MPAQEDPDASEKAARRSKRRAVSFVGNSRHKISAGFGAALRARRTALGLTQTDLAMASGLNRSFISDVERGKESISLDRAEKLAHGVDCKLVDLLAEAR